MNGWNLCILCLLVVAAACGCSSSKVSDLHAAKVEDPQQVRVVVPKTEPALAEQAETMARRGKRQYEAGLLDAAKATLEKAVQVDPMNQKAWYYLHRVQDSIHDQERKEQRRREFLHRWDYI